MRFNLILAIFFTTWVSAVSEAAQTTIPFMNLLTYRQQLLNARGLLPQTTCAMDLRIRPALHDEVLIDAHDFDWFQTESQYGVESRQIDRAWGQNQVFGIEAEENRILSILRSQGNNSFPWQDPQARGVLAQFGFYPGFYNSSFFTSYQVGPVQLQWFKPDGYVYKVFFEFKNPQTDLTADQYKEFSKRLQAAGFQGDSKIPLMSGWIRFYWNNVIVHAPTIESAVIAEQVGLNFFGPLLSSYSRGVDAQNQLTNGKVLDWPDFLCVVNPDFIPPGVLQYVNRD